MSKIIVVGQCTVIFVLAFANVYNTVYTKTIELSCQLMISCLALQDYYFLIIFKVIFMKENKKDHVKDTYQFHHSFCSALLNSHWRVIGY